MILKMTITVSDVFASPHFVVEAVEKFGPNVLGFQVATGERQWYIVGANIAPEDEETM